MTTSIPKPVLPPVTREAHDAALERARREEREECAKLCDSNERMAQVATEAHAHRMDAKAIRARNAS